MAKSTIVPFNIPSEFSADPLTEVIQAGAKELLRKTSAWRKISAPNRLPEVIQGVAFKDGIKQGQIAA